MDRVGLDVVLNIERHYASMRPGLPEGPRKLLRGYIDQGRLGSRAAAGSTTGRAEEREAMTEALRDRLIGAWKLVSCVEEPVDG
jgi:3-hydroxyacyl-CoA dehydrogenase